MVEHLKIKFGTDGAYVITGLPPGEECAYTFVTKLDELTAIAKHHGFEEPRRKATEWWGDRGIHVFHHPSDVSDTRGYGPTLQAAIVEADNWYNEDMYDAHT